MKFKLMMWFFLLFSLMAGLSLLGYAEQAYIAIVYPPWDIRVSFICGITLLIFVFFVFYTFVRLFANLLKMPAYFADYLGLSREHKALKKLHQTLKFLFSGKFLEADKSYEQAIKYINLMYLKAQKRNFLVRKKIQYREFLEDMANVANLLGAVSANSLKQYAQRTQRLNNVQNNAWKEARFLLEAKLALQGNEIDIADNALRQYFTYGGNSPLANQLASEVAHFRCNWSTMREQALLYEKGLNQPCSFSDLRVKADKHLLLEKKDDPDALLKTWESFDDGEKQILDLAEQCIVLLMDQKSYAAACDISEFVLSKKFSEYLLHLYSTAAVNLDISRAVAYVEKMQNKWPENASVFYVLGFLCCKQQIWGKAQIFFEKALSIVDSDDELGARIHFGLAKMFSKLDDVGQAEQHTKLGLAWFESFVPRSSRLT